MIVHFGLDNPEMLQEMFHHLHPKQDAYFLGAPQLPIAGQISGIFAKSVLALRQDSTDLSRDHQT